MRRMVIKEALTKNKAHTALIQESKLSSMSNFVAREVWGGSHIEWVRVGTMGSVGGILLLWDSRFTKVLDSWKGEFLVLAWVEDLANSSQWLVTSVYGPNTNTRIVDFWEELDFIRGRWDSPW